MGEKLEFASKVLSFIQFVLVVVLIVMVGYGVMNLEAVMAYTKEVIDLLKASR